MNEKTVNITNFIGVYDNYIIENIERIFDE